jgi:hypothetical protein
LEENFLYPLPSRQDIDDSVAQKKDWDWKPKFDLTEMATAIIRNIKAL